MPCGHLLGKGWPLGSFVMSNCEVVTFPFVPCVRYGAWLYPFLIFAPLLTLFVRRMDIAPVSNIAHAAGCALSLYISSV